MSPQLTLIQISDKMTNRDHSFNRSTRPLLERKFSPEDLQYPQYHQHQQSSPPLPHHHYHHQQQHYHYYPEQQPRLLLTKKKIINNYSVQGINDFNYIRKQYCEDTNSYRGFPYGSPPNSTNNFIPNNNINSSDFLFSDDSGFNTNNDTTLGTKISNNNNNTFNNTNRLLLDDDRSYDEVEGGNVNHISNSSSNSSSSASSNSFKFNELIWKRQLRSRQQNVPQENIVPDSTSNVVGGPFIFGIHTSNTNGFPQLQTPHIDNQTVICTRNYQKYSKQLNNNNNINEIQVSVADDVDQGKCLNEDETYLKKKKGRTKEIGDKKDDKENKKFIKCVLVGDGAVGKTNLIFSYLKNRFITEHIPTASDIYNFEVKVNGTPTHVTLCDTAGQDTLDQLRQLSYPDSDIFVLCFSVVKPESFKSIKHKWAPKFVKSIASLILIGTQVDLRDDLTVLEKLQLNGEKPITKTEAWEYATAIGAKYIETSSRTQIGVKEAFDTAIWDALVTLDSSFATSPPLWKRWLCLL